MYYITKTLRGPPTTPLAPVIRVDVKDAVPIWRQIEMNVQRLVVSGALAPRSAVPSVRDLAQELGVNPMTVSKAYQKLADAGFLEVRRGEGTFVPASPTHIGRADRIRGIREHAARFASVAVALGASEKEAIEEIRDAFSRLRKESGGTS